ncbi:hypothetical protein ACFLXB_01030 [Chloroflexota bacterium]
MTIKFLKIVDRNLVFTLLISTLFYSLGISLAHYLGIELNNLYLAIGFLWVISIQLTSKGYLLLINPEIDLTRDDFPSGQEGINKFRLFILFLFFAGVIFLAILLQGRTQGIKFWVLILLAYFGLFLFPSIMKGKYAYMPIVFAIFQASIIPGLAFILANSELPRSLLLMVFPLTLLLVAYNIAKNISTYARDVTINRKTILRAIGWRKGIYIHHTLLILSLIFLLLNIGKGLPSNFLLPVGLSVPLMLLAIFWLQRIKAGFNPIWPVFNIINASAICIPVYLFSYSLWIN